MAKKEILNNDALTVRVGEGAVDAVEGALDVLEGKIETLENITGTAVTITKNNPWLIGGALIAGLGLGGFIAYKITKKRMLAWHEEDLGDQIRMAQSFQKRLARKDEFNSPEEAAQALIPDAIVETVQTYQGQPAERIAYNQVPLSEKAEEVVVEPQTPSVEPPPVVVTAVDRNVFSPRNNPRDWDYQAEVAVREENPDKPYVISFEEFDENAPGHDQNSMVYYEGDMTMIDEQSKILVEVEKYVGEDNLSRFGHGSKDVNMVYVRNDAEEMDFEIMRDPGHYTVEVLGLDPEENTLKHSRQRGRRHRADE